MSEPTTTTVADGVARVSWAAGADVTTVGLAVAGALVEHARVEAHVAVADESGQRAATWSGMRREGVMRGVDGDHVVYARLVTDVAPDEPGGFRALLNSFLPRKRAIAQMLIRDDAGRVLMCQLTYKQDWDLPGGVVEVGESPRDAVVREVAEELQLDVPTERLLVVDWMPPWGGWDDALCLVFDGGTHPGSIVDDIVEQAREIRSAAFRTLEEIDAHAADFTARRVRAALAAVDSPAPGSVFVESGRSV